MAPGDEIDVQWVFASTVCSLRICLGPDFEFMPANLQIDFQYRADMSDDIFRRDEPLLMSSKVFSQRHQNAWLGGVAIQGFPEIAPKLREICSLFTLYTVYNAS